MELYSRWTDGKRPVYIERLEINPLEDKDTIFLVSEIDGRHSSIQRNEFKRKYKPLLPDLRTMEGTVRYEVTMYDHDGKPVG